MSEYLSVNKKVYSELELVREYNKRFYKTKRLYKSFLLPFIRLVEKSSTNKSVVEFLEIGCGVGVCLKILSEKKIQNTGLDVSRPMVEYAKMNSPKSKLIRSNFLEFNTRKKYRAIIALAFLHLFPSTLTGVVIRKVGKLLMSDGYFLVAIRVENKNIVNEGYFRKGDFSGKPHRFMRRFRYKEFVELMKQYGFRPEKEWQGTKKWKIFAFKSDSYKKLR